MNNLKIVMVDLNENYLIPIELKLIEMLGDDLELSIITNKQYLEEYFRLPRKIDILIIEESLYFNDLQKQDINNTFILLENNNELDVTKNLKLNTIYKYTGVREIYSQIINNSQIESEIKNKETKVVMMYSASGGVGTTTMSMGLAAALENRSMKVLYINTETVQSFYYMIPRYEYLNNNLEMDMISKDENILSKLRGAIGNNKFDYIKPFRQSLTSLNISLDDYIFLIDKIKESKIYDYIVVDTSNELTKEKSMFMGYSDKVIIITTQKEVDIIKLNALNYSIDTSNKSKFLYICNKYRDDKENYIIKDGFNSNLNISEYISEIDEELLDVNRLAKNTTLNKLTYMII